MVAEMESVELIMKNFIIPGKFVDARPYGSGHINDTLLIRYEQSGEEVKYILRKINDFVFKAPERIIENTVNVTNHIRQKLIENGEQQINNKVLTLIKSVDSKYYYVDKNKYWCLLHFIEGAYTVDHVDNSEQAYEAAKAYGKFEKYLSDYDTSKCHITIKNFHNLSNRIIAFKHAIVLDPHHRVQKVSDEISLAKKYLYLNKEFEKLQNKNLPIRITHNDTKINNIMLHQVTKEGICVVDLDTVMPGIVLNDFGDMVRTFTSPALEDDKDFSNVSMRLPIFDSLVRGYLKELNDYLTEDEINNLVLGAKIIVYEQAIRFLTDYLLGDVYYKIEYELHNLNRAKNQFELLASMEEQSEEMAEVISKYSLVKNSKALEN
jgi:Phosphotransferase enzyme family